MRRFPVRFWYRLARLWDNLLATSEIGFDAIVELFQVKNRKRNKRKREYSPLRLELLESRCMLSVAPMADDDLASTSGTTAVQIDVMDGDFFDSASVSIALDSAPQYGTVSLDDGGTPSDGNDDFFEYTPGTDFANYAQDTFTYTLSDVNGTDTGTVTIENSEFSSGGGNQAPTANDDNASTAENTPVTIAVLGNDDDPDPGDTLEVDSVGQAANGTVTNDTQSVTYTPNSGFTGQDSFTYTITDGTDTDTATVTITVTGVGSGGTNQAPVAVGESYSVVHDNSLYVAADGVLANDTDADGDSLTAVLVASTTDGTANLYSDGSFDYTPDSGFVGTDSFTYKAFDGAEYSAAVTVTIDVTNEAPVAAGESYSVVHDNTLFVAADGVLANDSDADGDALTAVLVTSTTDGTVILNADGSFDYTPDSGFVGLDSFTYRAFDGAEYSDPATVEINVTAEQVVSVILLPTGQGTTGDISNDNPNGQNGTPAFGGGWRFFPDAVSYQTRTVSRNIVRIRATLGAAQAGVMVHFRSFDVDDPSADNTIDANGATGRDNRGAVAGANLDEPAAAGANGFQGRLRPVGGNFAAEGAIVAVPTVINAQGQAIAEVELATSFNPGDNFRLVASTIQAQVAGLNAETGVPTSGAVPNFQGAASDQLSIWRRFHVEQDRMATIPFGLRQTGQIAGVVPNNLVNPLLPVTAATIVLDFQIMGANSFRGGNLRDQNGQQYQIISHDTANPSTVLVRVRGEAPTQQPAPQVGAVKLTQGDFQVGQITSQQWEGGGLLGVTTNIHITEWNEYAGGWLRTGGKNYPILNNTQGQNGYLVIEAFEEVDLTDVTIYQDDFISTFPHEQAPVARFTQPDHTNFYDYLEVSTVRAENRYADAYLEPEFNALNTFDSNNVTPVSHFPEGSDN